MSLTIGENAHKSYLINLPDNLQTLIQSLSSRRDLTPELVSEYILNAKIKPEDLLPWAAYNHPLTDSYGRKLVYDGGYFEVMVMSWIPGDFSAIHDHGHTQWGAVQCFGNATHVSYSLQDNVLKTEAEISLTPYEVVTVNHDLIHQMCNSTDSHFLTLHVYGCPNRDGDITGDARIFDLWEGCVQYTNGGVFFCLPESDITERSFGLQGDLETTIRHHEQMLARIKTIIKHRRNSFWEWQLKAKAIEQKIQELRT